MITLAVTHIARKKKKKWIEFPLVSVFVFLFSCQLLNEKKIKIIIKKSSLFVFILSNSTFKRFVYRSLGLIALT